MRKGTIKRPEGATEPIIRLVGNPDPHRVAENNERVEIPTYDEKAAVSGTARQMCGGCICVPASLCGDTYLWNIDDKG